MKSIITIIFLFIVSTSYSQISDVTYPFGNQLWITYCFNGNMVAHPSTTTYAGYYTENNFSFDSRKRYPYSGNSNAIPSNANSLSGNAYIGLPVGTVHTVVYKRHGFPSGYYQIDVTVLDDIGYLIINGVQIWNYQSCCQSHINVWRGSLDSTSTIEFEYINLASGSALAMNAVPIIDLPVSFIEFKTYQEETNVVLEWATASETNNDFFTIEKSTDGINFESIGVSKGSGTTNSVVSYKYVDENILYGTFYYRIKQTDFNKNTTYSTISYINCKESKFSIYPNPSSSNELLYITLNHENQLFIIVHDIQGKEYYSTTINDVNNITALNMGLTSGLYIITVSSKDSIFKQKIIVK